MEEEVGLYPAGGTVPRVTRVGRRPRGTRDVGRRRVRRYGIPRRVAIACIALICTYRIGEASKPGPPERHGARDPSYQQGGAAASGGRRTDAMDDCSRRRGGWRIYLGEAAGAAVHPNAEFGFDDPEGTQHEEDTFGERLCGLHAATEASAEPPADVEAMGDVDMDECTLDDSRAAGTRHGADAAPVAAPADADSSECPVYVAAPKFNGARDGYVYKVDLMGIGYYRDDYGAYLRQGEQQQVPQRCTQMGPTRRTQHAVTISLDHLVPRGEDAADVDADDDDAGDEGDGAATEPEPARDVTRPRTRGRPRRRRGGTFVLPDETTLEDAAHREAGIWAIDTANGNAWPKAADHLQATSADILLVQEARRRGAKRKAAERQARQKKWAMALTDANLTSSGRCSGGVGVGVRSYIGIAGGTTHRGCGSWSARYTRRWIGCVCRGGLHVASIWPIPSVGLSEENLQLLQEVAEDLGSLTGPWVVGGDWNLTPQQLAASGWLGLVGGVVCAPAKPTCNGSVYDYFVVAEGFADAVLGAVVIGDAEYSPHTGVRLYITAAARSIMKRVVTAPKSIGPWLPSGCLNKAAACGDLDETDVPGVHGNAWQARARTRGSHVGAGACAASRAHGAAPDSQAAPHPQQQQRQHHPGGGNTDTVDIGDHGHCGERGTTLRRTPPVGPSDGAHDDRGDSAGDDAEMFYQRWAKWVTHAERDLAGVMGLDGRAAAVTTGRAAGPRFRLEPAAGKTADPRPGSTAAAREWRCVAAWLRSLRDLAAQTRNGGRARPGTAAAAAAASSRLAKLAMKADGGVAHADARGHRPSGSAGHVDQGPRHAAAAALAVTDDEEALGQMVACAEAAAAAAEAKKCAEGLRAWQAWMRGGAANGLSRMHKFVRTAGGWVPAKVASQPAMMFTELDDVDRLTACEARRLRTADTGCQVPLSVQATVDSEARDWGELWDTQGRTADVAWPADLGAPPQRPSVAHLRAALRSFPQATGLAWDSWHPRSLLRLSDERLGQFLDLLMEAEARGCWPPELGFVSVVLLPKPEGGFRPIGLFPWAVRIWMRVRRGAVDNWEADNERAYFHAGRGKGAHVAAWKQATRAEHAAALKVSFAQLLLDLQKAFELVDHNELVKEAMEVGYPLHLLRLAVAAYRLPRAMVVDGAYSTLLDANRGITAGSGMATAELKVLVLRLLDRVSAKYPSLHLTAYVDDIGVEAAGTDATAVRVIVGAGTMLCDGLMALRLKLSTSGKCVCTSTSAVVGHRVADGLKEFGVEFVRHTKNLGVGTAAGARRCAHVQRGRLAKFLGKLGRIMALFVARSSPTRFLTTGGMSALTYGDDCCGVSDDALLRRRRAVAGVVAARCKGRDIDLTLAMAEAPGSRNVDPAYAAHALPLCRWAEAAWSTWVPLKLMHRSMALATAKVAKARRPWGAVNGTASAAVATAARIGWTFEDAVTLHTDRGTILDLRLDPPIVVKQEVLEAVRRWRWRRIADKHPQLAAGSPDGERALDHVRKLLAPAARHCEWGAPQQAALRSAVNNGQWPQARMEAAGIVDDGSCRLCAATGSHAGVLPPRGSLDHRVLHCPLVLATARGMLATTWPQFHLIRRTARRLLGLPAGAGDDAGGAVLLPRRRLRPLRRHGPDADDDHEEAGHAPRAHEVARRWGCAAGWVEELINGEGPHREHAARVVGKAIADAWDRARNVLAWTRGLVAMPLAPGNGRTVDGSFHWDVQPTDTVVSGTFYTDGSVFDSELGESASVGWSFVVIDDEGVITAAASGLAPCWVREINGAEAWALRVAAIHALPGATFVTDSRNCLAALGRGVRHATSPRNKLARVWRQVFGCFDDADSACYAASLVWMPAHRSRSDVGKAIKSDGSVVTERDWLGNARADALAKAAARGARAPLAYRAECKALEDVLRKAAMHLGWTTWAANNCPVPPYADSETRTPAQKRAAREAAANAAEAGVARQPRARIAHTRPAAIGGHSIRRGGVGWECTVCRASARLRSDLAPRRCPGLAVQRWAELEAAECGRAAAAGAIARRHVRWMSGDLVWCSVCGAYGEHKAVNLASACAGPPPRSGAGRTTALHRLRAGRHPKHNTPIVGPPVPEPTTVQHRGHGDVLAAWWGRKGGMELGQRERVPPAAGHPGAVAPSRAHTSPPSTSATSSSTATSATTAAAATAFAAACSVNAPRMREGAGGALHPSCQPAGTCHSDASIGSVAGKRPASAPTAAAQRIDAIRQRLRARHAGADAAAARGSAQTHEASSRDQTTLADTSDVGLTHLGSGAGSGSERADAQPTGQRSERMTEAVQTPHGDAGSGKRAACSMDAPIASREALRRRLLSAVVNVDCRQDDRHEQGSNEINCTADAERVSLLPRAGHDATTRRRAASDHCDMAIDRP